MVCAIKQFFKRTPEWVVGWFKRNASNWAKQLYVAAILLYSGWIIWQVSSRTAFLPRSVDPTLIQLDLLQAMAFLVAWSALIITITAKTVSTSKEFESKIAKVGWDTENNQSMMETLKEDLQRVKEDHQRVTEDHQRVTEDHQRVTEDHQRVLSRVGRAKAELLPRIDALTQENEQLRQQLGMPEPADDHVR